MQVLFDEVMRDSTAQTDRRLPIAKRIPGEPDARIEMSPLRVDSRRAWESRITRITESRRRVRDHRALLAAVKISQVEVIVVALLRRHSEERRPVNSVRQRQFWRHFPGVLGV